MIMHDPFSSHVYVEIKILNTAVWNILTFNKGKTSPTVKLENQFTMVDTETAADRGPCEKISATINQGIDPEVRMRD